MTLLLNDYHCDYCDGLFGFVVVNQQRKPVDSCVYTSEVDASLAAAHYARDYTFWQVQPSGGGKFRFVLDPRDRTRAVATGYHLRLQGESANAYAYDWDPKWSP